PVRYEVRGLVVQDQVDRYVRIGGLKLSEQRGDDLAAKARGRADTQVPAWRPFSQVTDLLDCLGDPVDAAMAALVEEITLARKGRAPGGPQEESDLELVLQPLDIPADRGTADSQPVRSPCEAAFG